MRIPVVPVVFVAALAIAAVPARPAWTQAAPAPAADKPADTRVVTQGKSKLTLYGFLRFDAVYDSARPNNIQIPGFILSPDLNAPQGPAAGHDDFSAHPRLTRVGLDFEAPEFNGLGHATLTGKLEIDFYNLPATPSSLNTNSREYLRLRHAWAKLAWRHFSLLAGQREDVISPLSPTVNNDLVMWGAGNLADRRAQVRAELALKGLTVTAMAGVAGAVDAQNLEGTANQFFDGEASGVPALQGRVGWTFNGPAAKKKSTIGVWGHWAREKLDVARTFANGRTRFTSDVIGADLSLVLASHAWIKAEGWTGKNLDDVRGGIFQGVVNGEEVEGSGGWVELGLPVGHWTPVLGISIDDPDNQFLPRKSATTNPGQDKNFIWYVSARWRSGALETGIDYLHWRTSYVGPGVADGVDHRFNVLMAYHF